MWKYTGRERPPFAHNPMPGQESVWDYPRPPVLKKCGRSVLILTGNEELAKSVNTLRLLETASPPGYYIPNNDVNWEFLSPVEGSSLCEWKGLAVYWKLSHDISNIIIGWSYPDPAGEYAVLKDYISFYPGRLECYVDSERVLPQPGKFYGGWITHDIAGPVKGEPGTGHW